MQDNRIHFFDAMRSILIIFIVIIHIAQIFNPEKSWLIYNQDTSIIFYFIVKTLMLFSLQSFFIMSGYLAAMNINRVGSSTFFNSRIKRTLIPIIVTAITLNSIQVYLLEPSKWVNFNLYLYLKDGLWVSHLWFLIDLSLFFLLTYLSVKFIPKTIQKLSKLLNIYFIKFNLYFILFLFAFAVVFLQVFYSLTAVYLQNSIINFSSILFYFPFYLLGTLMFKYKNIFINFITVPLLLISINTILFVLISYYTNNTEDTFIKLIHYFAEVISNLLATMLCFTLFYKYLNRRSKIFTHLSNASYSIYIFHHVLVIYGGLLLIKIHINSYIGFMILLIFILITTLAIHQFFISKLPLLSFLFNGTKIKKEQQS